jgi:preprotein translocase subunit YajC
LVLLVGLSVATTRNRRRNLAAEQERAAKIAVGTDVMTTSGLYGTVVARNADDSVLLAIAPGVEVRWAAAALRDVADLPEQYRPGTTEADGDPAEHEATDDDAR